MTQPMFSDGEDELGYFVYGYMCKTDYECELGMAAGGNMVYSSEEDLRENRSCVEECGVVKVKIHLAEVIQESNY
jgi:hypothetical protein